MYKHKYMCVTTAKTKPMDESDSTFSRWWKTAVCRRLSWISRAAMRGHCDCTCSSGRCTLLRAAKSETRTPASNKPGWLPGCLFICLAGYLFICLALSSRLEGSSFHSGRSGAMWKCSAAQYCRVRERKQRNCRSQRSRSRALWQIFVPHSVISVKKPLAAF